jgi:aminoglycoside N3'-acetyltransferase
MGKVKTFIQWLSKQSVAKLRVELVHSLLLRKYTEYSSEDFINSLKRVGICSGDSVFLMYSQDKIYSQTGKIIPLKSLLNDLICYLGENGTLMTLCFPIDRSEILTKKKVFNVKKTATESGILAEILRRKQGSQRSFNPIFSAISYGKKSKLFSSCHHQSPYPFDSQSPYYKIMIDGGKYLGIGVGFEAFTPCHMIEDHFKDKFRYKMYLDTPEKFTITLPDGSPKYVNSYTRSSDPLTSPMGGFNPLHYFDILNIESHKTLTRSGIKLFTFKIQDFFNAAVNIYELKSVTVWDTGSLFSLMDKKIRTWKNRLRIKFR